MTHLLTTSKGGICDGKCFDSRDQGVRPWKAAERELFYATAPDHYTCPIGPITQGFQVPQPVSDNAMELIGMMGKISYLEAAEASNVPTIGEFGVTNIICRNGERHKVR